jgi:uncharacterized membrane protein
MVAADAIIRFCGVRRILGYVVAELVLYLLAIVVMILMTVRFALSDVWAVGSILWLAGFGLSGVVLACCVYMLADAARQLWRNDNATRPPEP